MSGILNNKTRMLDTIMTREGRRQLAAGDLRIEFVSFTDGETFYEKDVASGSTDPSGRIMIEAASLPQDQVTFEADDSGRLMPFKNSDLGVVDGKVLSGSSDKFLTVLTGAAFASTSELLLDSSINSFEKLLAVRTEDVFFDADTEFATSTNQVGFTITDAAPIILRRLRSACVDRIESLFQDKKLSHIPNFRYLPPINRPSPTEPEGSSLGDYPLLGQRKEELSFEEIEKDLRDKESTVIEFSRSTSMSNAMCQMFEMRQDRLLKLDVVDYGEVMTDDPEFPEKHVFFVGKLFIDSFGAHTFLNIFTMIYE